MTTVAPAAPRAAVKGRPADIVFRAISTAAGVLILIALGGVAIFLVAQAVPAIVGPIPESEGANFWDWVWPITFGTLWSSFLAMVMAVAYLPVDPWVRAFLGLGTLYLTTSAFTLAKCVRDAQEDLSVVSRIDQARVDKILAEHDPFRAVS